MLSFRTWAFSRKESSIFLCLLIYWANIYISCAPAPRHSSEQDSPVLRADSALKDPVTHRGNYQMLCWVFLRFKCHGDIERSFPEPGSNDPHLFWWNIADYKWDFGAYCWLINISQIVSQKILLNPSITFYFLLIYVLLYY